MRDRYRIAIDPLSYDVERTAIPWTEGPFFDALLEESHLGETDRELVERFATDGVLIFDPQIPDDLLERVRIELEASYPALARNEVARVQDAWTKCSAVRELAAWPTVLDTLRLLYRRDPIPFQTLNFALGSQQRTHADTIHFQTHPANWMAGVWIALEDVDSGNGPLHYVKGSHRLPVYGPSEIGISSDFQSSYSDYEDFIGRLIDMHGLQREELRAPRGSAVIWAANLLHGGTPIRSPGRTRHSQATHYFFPGCTYYTPMSSEVFLGRVHHRVHDLVDIRDGRRIPHSFKGVEFKPRVRRAYPVAGTGRMPTLVRRVLIDWRASVSQRLQALNHARGR